MTTAGKMSNKPVWPIGKDESLPVKESVEYKNRATVNLITYRKPREILISYQSTSAISVRVRS